MRASTFFALGAVSLLGFVAAAPTPQAGVAVAVAAAALPVDTSTVETSVVEQEDVSDLESRGLTKAQKKKQAEQKAKAKKAAAEKQKKEAAAKKKAAEQKKKQQQQQSSNVVLAANTQTFSGQGTFYFQNGNYGSCGVKNPDSAVIVAVNTPQVAGGKHCGRMLRITNTRTGKSITARVADECPTCAYGSLDLSTGAYDQLATRNEGVFPIKWQWA